MNISSEEVSVNFCQYTPVYLIQDPGSIQANAYVVTQNSEEHPVTNNLKTFYENSGNIENIFLNSSNLAKPSVMKKTDGIQVRRNYKLSSFLLPKSDNINKQYASDKVASNTTTTTTTTTTTNRVCSVNTVPKINMARKIVKIKDTPVFNRRAPEKPMPKIKPKENVTSHMPSNHTSVQLIKLGETYHSLNKLSEKQMKMVSQALKIFNDPSKNTPEPTYDPVTNTRYIYKVVSPKDLAVVGKRKITSKDKRIQAKVTKKVEEKEIHTKPIRKVEDKFMRELIEEEEELEVVTEAKVTRSGRKVKLPKQILPEDVPLKAKKKSETIVTCFQCSAHFSSLYRLQKHFESHPTHIPAKIHSNLFHCLLAIIKSGSDEDKTNIFIQQLEQLVVKLKSLLPCLLKKVDGTEGQACKINDDIGRLFGMNPGKYNIDVNALDCLKDKNGYCIHNPPKANQSDLKSQLEHLSNETNNTDNETENCARINSVAKWPTVSKRLWKLKHRPHELNTKKIKTQGESPNECVSINVLEADELTKGAADDSSAMVSQNNVKYQEESDDQCDIIEPSETDRTIGESRIDPKNNHIKFHSTHFDIRSSPIKSSSTSFRKFQINPSKLASYDAQVIPSLAMVDKEQNRAVITLNNDNTLHDLFKSDVDISRKATNGIDHELKEWIMNTNEKSQDSFTKSVIEPSLLHVKDEQLVTEKDATKACVSTVTTHNESNQTESVLNFLEELGNDLAYPETEIRNSGVDFQLDLFTFSNN